MSGPPPPPAPPEPQPYRLVSYPNYFLGSLAYGDQVTIATENDQLVTAPLMDLSPYGVTVWVDGQLMHAQWAKIKRISWNPPEQ